MNDRGRPILLRSGVIWYPVDPRPEDVRYEDMRALARKCRWSDHTRVFYSVAEHCVRVARYLLDHLPRATRHPRAIALQGLVHDGHEVYPPGDVPGPLLSGDTPEASALRGMERRARDAYRTAIGLPHAFDDAVHHADLVLLATEARDLMPVAPEGHFKGLPEPMATTLEPWSEERAWFEWDRLYRELGGVVL